MTGSRYARKLKEAGYAKEEMSLLGFVNVWGDYIVIADFLEYEFDWKILKFVIK